LEWLYSTQVDLDRFGNCFGIITARDGLGFPARIELVSAESVTVRTKAGRITSFMIDGVSYEPLQIWHEKQFTVAGVPVGLSPLAAAALTLSTSKSAQTFAADWFAGSGVPASHLKNTAQTLDGDQADAIKARFNESVTSGDVFVTGSDWDYQMLGAKASDSSFIEAQHATAADMCRFLGVPGDMVDVNEQTGSVTYANITQRNLQLLIINLGPAVTRRESALSLLLPQPRYVKLNTDAVVLRMDPTTRAELNAKLIESHQRTPSEVREKDDLPPFTPEQIAEIQSLSKSKPAPPQAQTSAPTINVDARSEHRIDARQEPPVVNVDARQEPPIVNVDARTEPAVVNVANEFTMPDIDVDARSEPPVVHVTNEVHPAAVEQRATRQVIEHTADGRIAAIKTEIIEEPVQ
jgi:HK97 family phage portal protein